MKNKIVLLILFGIPLILEAQPTLTLDDCYAMAIKNYPLATQNSLLQQKTSYEIEGINKDKLPKIDLNTQASYQSEVIALPITMPGVTPLNKDQYRATLEVNQLLYNGGTIKANSKLKEAQSKTQQQQIEVNLYQLKSRINHYYFSILLLQEKKALLVSNSELLLTKLQEVKSGVKFGAILPASELILEAEILKIKQQLTEIKFEKIKMLQNISELTFTNINSEAEVVQPIFSSETTEDVRPEITFYDLQNQQIDYSKKLISKTKLPRINAFGQTGYGNPGLNMLDNSFQPFYIIGVKANWNVFDWGKNKIDQKALDISKEIVKTEKATFELNNKMELKEMVSEITKTQEFLKLDTELIGVREKILKSSNAQMKNGVITTAEYLIEFTNLFEAKNSLKTHEVQLALAKSNYEIIKGN